MRRFMSRIVWAVVFCSIFVSMVSADTLIYNNSIYQGTFTPGSNYDIFDYGTSSGGLVSKISFGYRNLFSTTSWIRIKFYRNPNPDFYDFHLGYYIKTILIENVPSSSSSYSVFEYMLPEADRFVLPSGSFGYTIAVSSSSTDLAMARGGAGQVDEMWEYYYGSWGWDWYSFWFGGYPSAPWAGLYMRIYEGPPINEVTCDIAGYKFDDVNSNGLWDAGEPEIPGWEIYLDTNGNNTFDPGVDPNVVTDPNGMYFFENLDAPATYTIREVDRDGWTQTVPGGDYEYTLVVEPNHVYGPYNFGNTDEYIPADIKLYGTVEAADGEPVEGVRVEFLNGFTSVGGPDYTDELGYYEITVTAPFTGAAILTKPGWKSNTWSLWHDGLTTDYHQNFEMIFIYDGGDGSEGDPWQIRTVEQLEMIRRQEIHFDDAFVMTGDIDLSGNSYIEPFIGMYYKPFTGTFDGGGFSILNLQSQCGVFGDLYNAVVKNLGIENVNISGFMAGALCSDNHGGTIENCFSTGQIYSVFDAGGLCAWSHQEQLGDTIVIPGQPPITTNMPVIRNCYSTVDVTVVIQNNLFPEIAFGAVGGLCGYAESTELVNNYACGSVHAEGSVSVYGTERWTQSGGLVGRMDDCAAIHNYSSGLVEDGVYNEPAGFCSEVNGGSSVGNFWDVQTSDQSNSACGEGHSTDAMIEAVLYSSAGWDFETVWRICDGMNYPRLQWEPKPVGDFGCPEGVELADLMVLSDEWLAEKMSADIAPDGGDGIVNLLDCARLANAWLSIPGQGNWDAVCDLYVDAEGEIINELDLDVLTEQWLRPSTHHADIAPVSNPDGRVNLLDFALFAENWLVGLD